MGSVFNDYTLLSRLIFAINTVGHIFLSLTQFTSVVKRFVYGQNPEEANFNDPTHIEESKTFAAETESLLEICPSLKETNNPDFKKFHDFTLACGLPLGTVLVSERQSCRKCTKSLTLDKKEHLIVIYHSERGTYLGNRLTKNCRRCKIYEHYGYWTQGGKKYFDADCLKNDYLLSTEDTAFQVSLLRQCENLLIVGAVAFSTFTRSYN